MVIYSDTFLRGIGKEQAAKDRLTFEASIVLAKSRFLKHGDVVFTLEEEEALKRYIPSGTSLAKNDPFNLFFMLGSAHAITCMVEALQPKIRDRKKPDAIKNKSKRRIELYENS